MSGGHTAERERARLDEEREAKIATLKDELAHICVELYNERQLCTTLDNKARMAAAERDEALRKQLADLTTMVRQNQALREETMALMEEHWAEEQRWKEERDVQIHELMGMISHLMDEQGAARQREEEQRQANECKPGESNGHLPSLLGSSKHTGRHRPSLGRASATQC